MVPQLEMKEAEHKNKHTKLIFILIGVLTVIGIVTLGILSTCLLVAKSLKTAKSTMTGNVEGYNINSNHIQGQGDLTSNA